MAKFQAPESGYAGRLGLVVAKHLGVEISISACTDGVEVRFMGRNCVAIAASLLLHTPYTLPTSKRYTSGYQNKIIG